MNMVKELLRRYLHERMMIEAEAMNHFNDRVSEVLYKIYDIKIPEDFYLPNIDKETQNKYLIQTIQTETQKRIDEALAKDYPIGGSAVVVPLGPIFIESEKGKKERPLIHAIKGEKNKVFGVSYYVAVYDNRATSLVLANPNYPENKSAGGQLSAHIRNTVKSGYRYNKEKSYADTFLNNPLIIPMSGVVS